jgi:hypothetical protein
MNKENGNLNRIVPKTTEIDILFNQLFQQTHPLHALTVDNLNAVLQFFPQNSSELSDYVQKAQNEAQHSLDLVSKWGLLCITCVK